MSIKNIIRMAKLPCIKAFTLNPELVNVAARRLKSAPISAHIVGSHIYTKSNFNSVSDLNATKENITIDAEEVAKFGAMSQEWWDPIGNFKLLHSMNLPRVEYILEQLKSSEFGGIEKLNSLKPLEGFKVLDVGCGGGILSEPLARLGAMVTAVDASHQNIAIAKLHKAQDPVLNDTPDRLQYFCMTSHDLLTKTGPGAFDIVCSLEVIEHVQQPQEFIHSLKELVCPNGPVFVSTINRNPLSYFLTIGMAEHILRLTPVGTHHFNKYITPEELKSMMHASGLVTQNMTNIHFNPLQGVWHLGNSIYPQHSALPPVNYIAMATRVSV